MKRLKYMAVNHTIKEDGDFKIIAGQHVCGGRLLFCMSCNRIFCPTCDFIPGKVSSCCSAAIGAYTDDNEQKFVKREAIKKQIARRPKKSGRYKYKIKLEEIICENSL